MFLKKSSIRGVMRFVEEGEVGIKVALASNLITLFSRLYLNNIPISVLVKGRVCFFNRVMAWIPINSDCM